MGTHETYHLLSFQNIRAHALLGSLMAFVIALSGYSGSTVSLSASLLTGFFILATAHLRTGTTVLANLAGSIFGLVYPAWLGAHILLLHGTDPHGAGLVMLLIVAVVATDAFAYFAGKFLGKHKMAPRVSPNKTWEGAAGGFLGAVAGMAVLYACANAGYAYPDWPLVRYLLTGALLSVFAQVGDLFESSLKRAAGVKDAGRIFPGHGGVLDRCDGFLFAAPLLYYMAQF